MQTTNWIQRTTFYKFSEANDNRKRNTLNRFARITKPFSTTCSALLRR